MIKVRTILAAVVLLTAQQVFADDTANLSETKPCATIAKACLGAGFVRGASETKGIWRDCMKPVILGKTVSGVTIEPSVVKACRVDKINALSAELKEFQNVK